MDHHDKLAWAAQHLHALDLDIRDFLTRYPVTARGEQRDSTRQFDIIVNDMPLLPGHWPLMAGDAIRNLRSALDHVIWALANKSPTGPSAQEALNIGFPICTNKGAYWGERDQKGNGARKRHAGWIADDALAIVDDLQPYHRGDGAPEHPLAVIAAFSNADKHRNLIASAVLATPVRFTFTMVGHARQQVITGYTFTPNGAWLLYKGANLGLLEFSEGTTCDPGEMIAEPDFSASVAFGVKGTTPLLDVPALEKILDTIHEGVIAPLDRILMR